MAQPPLDLTLDAVRQPFQHALEFAASQVRTTHEADPDFYPMYTRAGRWKHDGEQWTDWCKGFFPGIMWQLHRYSGDPWMREKAELLSKRLESKQHDRDVHDLGFIFLSTYLPWYELTHDPALNQVLITAGKTLALRFMPKGRYLRSFVAPESLFIDIMMNVPIIFRAARETGDPDLFELAKAHCRTTATYLVRPDGGTAHEGIFNLDTGEFLKQTTHQGLRGDSDWTRGLAWSLYGFGTVFTYTHDPDDLNIARRNADHFLERLDDSFVPPWDFDVPEGPDRIPDSSAGAIAASGLLQLADLVADHADPADPEAARRYRAAALAILRALCQPSFLADQTPGWEGILKRGVYHFHKKLGVDESVIFGDYFFVEALRKALALETLSASPGIGS